MATLIHQPLSVDQAAAALEYTTGRIRQLLRAGTLTGKKLNQRAWMIDAASVDALKRRKRARKSG